MYYYKCVLLTSALGKGNLIFCSTSLTDFIFWLNQNNNNNNNTDFLYKHFFFTFRLYMIKYIKNKNLGANYMDISSGVESSTGYTELKKIVII